MREEEKVRLSKTISYALRHDPASFGLSLDHDGSVAVDELLKGISRAKHISVTRSDLEEVLTMPGKKRFVVENDRICAYYGHTLQDLEVERPLIQPPDVLYHGTTHKALDKIMKEGLKTMNRQHVHLASTIKSAMVVGKRRDSNPPILLVDAKRAYEDGIKFYQGNEDIYLSDPIPAKYLKLLS